MDVTIYTKQNCDRCKALKAFFEEYAIDHVEKDIELEDVVKELIGSKYVIENFCDAQECIVVTPIVKIDGNWMHKEFFNDDGAFLEDKTKQIFKLI